MYINLESNLDVLFQNDEQLSAEEVLITGCPGEIKVEQIRADGENKCFYNMFSQGTNLAMKAISTGSIPMETEMYGIAVAIKKPREAKLVYLNIQSAASEDTSSNAPNCISITKTTWLFPARWLLCMDI